MRSPSTVPAQGGTCVLESTVARCHSVHPCESKCSTPYYFSHRLYKMGGKGRGHEVQRKHSHESLSSEFGGFIRHTPPPTRAPALVTLECVWNQVAGFTRHSSPHPRPFCLSPHLLTIRTKHCPSMLGLPTEGTMASFKRESSHTLM